MTRERAASAVGCRVLVVRRLARGGVRRRDVSSVPTAPVSAPKLHGILSKPPDRPFLMFVSLSSDSTSQARRARAARIALMARVRHAAHLRSRCFRRARAVSGQRGPASRRGDASGLRVRRTIQSGQDDRIERTAERTRLSADGRRAAFTVFDEGHCTQTACFPRARRSSTPSKGRCSAIWRSSRFRVTANRSQASTSTS